MISHSKKPDWATLLLLAAMYGLLGLNIYLYTSHRLPVLAHILISAVAIHLAFTIWHEAAHGNVFKNKWGNYITGIVGIFPYSTPFFIQRHVHLMHHAKMNQPDDPNLIYAEAPFWKIPFRYIRAISFLKKLLKKDPRKKFELRIDQAMMTAVAGIYLAAALTGHFKALLVLWTVPVVIAKVIMDWYINYLPHVGLPPHKYLGTRIVDIAWLTPLLLSHNYHAIHHLWPQLSWRHYFKVFTERKEILIQNGVPIERKLTRINYVTISQAV